MHAKIIQQGYTGSYPTLERCLQQWRHQDAPTPVRVLRNRPPPIPQVTAWITDLPGHLDSADEARFRAIQTRCPEIDAAVAHVAGFARMTKDLSGDQDKLTEWMAAVDHDLPALRMITVKLPRAIAAATAGLIQ